MIVYPTVRFILKLVYMYNVEQLQAALICPFCRTDARLSEVVCL